MKQIIFLICLFFACCFVSADAESDFQVGMDYYRYRNYKQAAVYLKKSAEQGEPAAQYYLGLMYRYGNGVSIDYKKAFYLFKKSAEQGNADAQVRLGRMYQWGTGVRSNYRMAVFWYTKASKQGNIFAQFSLGQMYHYGTGTPEDSLKSKYYINRAYKSRCSQDKEFWKKYNL